MLNINPWFKIWTSPKNTLLEIVNFNPKYKFTVLCFIYGLVWCFSLAQTLSLGHYYGVEIITILSLLIAVPIGYIFMNISSSFFWLAGKIFGGKGDFMNIRAAVAWANVPTILTILGWFYSIFAYGPLTFIQKVTPAEIGMPFLNVFFVIQFVAGIWSLVILIAGIAQVQSFSNWRSLGSVIIVSCIWLLVTILLVYGLVLADQIKVALDSFNFSSIFIV